LRAIQSSGLKAGSGKGYSYLVHILAYSLSEVGQWVLFWFGYDIIIIINNLASKVIELGGLKNNKNIGESIELVQ